MLDFSIKKNDGNVIRSIETLDADIQNIRPKLMDAEKIILASTEQTFQQEGRPAKWLKLADSTLKRRRKGKGSFSAKILQDTGLLKNSIRGTIVGDNLKVGPSVRYGQYHQFGFPDRGGGLVPARPFMLLQEPEDIDRIFSLFIPEIFK